MKLTNSIKLSVLAGLLFLLSGCFDDITKVYDGPAVVEFAQYSQPFSPGNNYTSTLTFASDDETSVVELSYLLQLISPQFNQETHIGFVINEVERTNSSGAVLSDAAQEGVHYSAITTNNQAVFPVNTSTSNVAVEVYAENLDPGDSVYFVIELVEGDQLLPAENYKTFGVILNKAQ